MRCDIGYAVCISFARQLLKLAVHCTASTVVAMQIVEGLAGTKLYCTRRLTRCRPVGSITPLACPSVCHVRGLVTRKDVEIAFGLNDLQGRSN